MPVGLSNPYIVVQPAMSTSPVFTVPLANTKDVPPLIGPICNEVGMSDELEYLIIFTAYHMPSRETVDQKSPEDILKTVVSSAAPVVSLVRPVPSVSIFHSLL